MTRLTCVCFDTTMRVDVLRGSKGWRYGTSGKVAPRQGAWRVVGWQGVGWSGWTVRLVAEPPDPTPRNANTKARLRPLGRLTPGGYGLPPLRCPATRRRGTLHRHASYRGNSVDPTHMPDYWDDFVYPTSAHGMMYSTHATCLPLYAVPRRSMDKLVG
jgi:hypothetical protein